MTAQVYLSGRRLALGAAATSAHWIGEEAAFTMGDGGVLFAAREGEARRVEVHEGAILSAALHPDGKRIVSGGDDGSVRTTAADGVTESVAELGKWVDLGAKLK